jgi:phosphoribosyl 1,2-cyclic phosphate phosphodiesterase
MANDLLSSAYFGEGSIQILIQIHPKGFLLCRENDAIGIQNDLVFGEGRFQQMYDLNSAYLCDMEVEFTFLGTGTSQGVPIIACECGVCSSSDARDQRLRSSVLVQVAGVSVVIDTGPDFRQQCLRAGVKALDAVVFTHEHKDHVAGLDDIRPFNFRSGRDMPIFATERVQEALQREFKYIFESTYPGVPKVSMHTIDTDEFDIGGVAWWPLLLHHHQLPVLGFRVGGFAYITDANQISEQALARLNGVDVLVLNALRREPHLSHFTLDEAVDWAKRIGARQTYFTHISHQLGHHADVERELPPGIGLAYDGLKGVAFGKGCD